VTDIVIMTVSAIAIQKRNSRPKYSEKPRAINAIARPNRFWFGFILKYLLTY